MEMTSIMNTESGRCYLCGRCGPTELHHVFMGCRRQTADKYGLTVYLCHHCHIDVIHQNHDACLRLQQHVQKQAMQYYDWSIEDWLERIDKNYL